MHSSMGHHLGGYTFEACLFGTDLVRSGVDGVDVLGTVVVEVVVHVREAVEVRVFDNGHHTRSEVVGRGSRMLQGRR